MDYVKLGKFSIKNYPQLNETWVQIALPRIHQF